MGKRVSLLPIFLASLRSCVRKAAMRNKALTTRLIFTCLLAFSPFSPTYAAEVSEKRQKELRHLLRHDCGSCHGLTLKGGVGPSLLPDVMQKRDFEYLVISILEGHNGTPMPAWKSILNRQEVEWIVRELRKGLDDEK